ncbi:unnamed protein product [Clonostachys rosea]|uniref:Zinc-ribbon 15 domain-containing protein n=1 Tax=Bionectria ochroleuca TaxID=29856 RepID=A0ABY6TVY8_BIOOC|nr:unnamed protein product [Clonostachys rosea]
MFFFFVCGEHTFRKELPGYEGVICQCHHCGNMSGHVLQRRPFFTFCFVPIIPFTISGYKDIVCHICNHTQPLEARPDVQAMANGGAGPGGPIPQGPPPNQQYQQGPPQPDYKQQSAPGAPPQYR